MTCVRPFTNILLVLAVLVGVSTAQSFAQRPEAEAIIFGDRIQARNAPFVELVLKLRGGSFATCSGTVIGKRTILTAGHCVSAISKIVAVFGEGHKYVSAKSWWRHPGYRELRSGKISNDIGIVRLKSDIPKGTPKLRVASRLFTLGELFYIYGYGVTENNSSDQLRGGIMQAATVSNSEISAYLDSGGSLSCVGDSGGPALRFISPNSGYRAEVVGIISSGDVGCSVVSYFSPVTSSSARSFIKKYLQ